MNTEPNATNILHENNNFLVTEEGELFQKETPLFKGRKLGTVDTENLDESLEPFLNAFDELEKKVAEKIEELGAMEDSAEISRQFEDLIEQIKNADAIGDFSELIRKIREKQDELLKTDETQTSEAETNSKEATEVVTEPGVEDKPAVDENNPVDTDPEEPAGITEESTATDTDESIPDAVEEENKESTAEETPEPAVNQGLNLDFDVPEELSVYHEIIEKSHSLLHGSDIQYANMEFDNLRRKWSDGPGVEEEQQEIYNKLSEIFNNQQKEFQNRKSAHYDEIHQKKIKNLERKNDLLSRLKSIIEQKKWHALNEVQGIQKRWDNIRLVDSQEAEPINRQYNTLIEEFEKNRVEYLVARKEKEEQNHTLKLTILDKISSLLNRVDENFSDWKSLDREYNELLREWKKVGRVPREKASEIWQRYKDLCSTYYDKKLTYDTSYRNEVEKRYAKKQELVKEAQALAEAEDLALAARSINKLHKRWKDVGALPKEQTEELWTQFKAATDTFNERKAENIDLLRDQENDNYETKVKLCEEAESIKDTDNWKEGTNRMQELMEQWKAVGPVPRRKTRKIWRRFKKAMDEFYDRKRDFFKEERQKQKENLKQKREIIEKIFALGDHEDPIEARELIKPLQKAFSEIGFVPIKQKNKIYKQYREACDVVYQRARAADRGGPILSKQAVLSSDDRRELRDKQNLFNKLRKECEKLNELILSYSDSQTFIRPNKQGLKLRNEIQEKIDNAKEELESKQEKVEELRQEIEEIRSGESS
ncbi:MAG TPA: DUF349 domain-containing protein [Balneolales bacterium]|nr:DUF349 domain-containing protein [Balneolales bacterium]